MFSLVCKSHQQVVSRLYTAQVPHTNNQVFSPTALLNITFRSRQMYSNFHKNNFKNTQRLSGILACIAKQSSYPSILSICMHQLFKNGSKTLNENKLSQWVEVWWCKSCEEWCKPQSSRGDWKNTQRVDEYILPSHTNSPRQL